MESKELRNLYIAHRGIQTEGVLENTIPAFTLAIEKNVPIELDIHLLKDGNLVVFHDDTLERLFGIKRRIDSYDYDELSQLKLETGEIIPLFQEVLALIHGQVLLVIEIKRTKISPVFKYCQKIVDILEQYPYDFVIKSFDVRIVYWFLHHTSYLTGLLIANPKRKKPASIYDILMNRNLFISWLNPNFISIDYHVLPSKMVQQFRKRGPVLLWTIQKVDTLKRIENNGDSYLIEKCYF